MTREPPAASDQPHRGKTVLLTGGTGFVGSYLTCRLLQTGCRVILISRQSADATRDTILETYRNVVTRQSALPMPIEQIEVLAGDVSQPGLGVPEAEWARRAGTINAMIHSAASIKLEAQYAEELRRTNVAGVRHVAALMDRLAIRRLHYISTAYVCGRREDVVAEADLRADAGFHNAYESSKYEAERVIWEWQRAGDRNLTIYRPSIVVGVTDTGYVPRFNGFYQFLRAFKVVRRHTARRLGWDHRNGPLPLALRVPIPARGSVNMVPIDYVAEACYRIGLDDASINRTFHITNPAPPPCVLIMEEINRAFHVTGPEAVDPARLAAAELNEEERTFAELITSYRPYMSGTPAFDTRNTRELLEPTGLRPPTVDRTVLRNLIGYFTNGR